MLIPPMPSRDNRPAGDRCEVTLRDTFAAAALTGLTANGDYSVEATPILAYRMADAMLRERERTNHDAAPAARASVGRPRTDKADLPTRCGTGDKPVTEPLPVFASGSGSVTPVSYEKSDEKRVLYDTKSPRNGALSGCETVPDPDSRVWETPRTSQPHATPAQGGVRGDGSVPCSRTGNDPAAWAVTMGDGSVYEAFAAHQYDEAVALARKCLFGSDLPLPLEPLYRQPTLTDVARESLAAMACYFDSRSDLQMQAWGSLLRGLLERAK